MSNTMRHLCPSCGGNLTVDKDKQMYYCESCGSTYDYEYFREEEMHDMGDIYLSRGEFMAAIDAYKFILKNDPHDFPALRGLMLAAARLKNMDELAGAKKTGFKYDTKLVSEVIESALEEDKEYFTEWEQIYSKMKRRSDCKAELITLAENKRSIEAEAEMKDKKSHSYYLTGKYGRELHPLDMFITLWVLGALLISGAIMFYFVFNSSPTSSEYEVLENRGMALGFAVPHAIGGIICVIWNMVGVYPKLEMVNLIKKNIAMLKAEAEGIEQKIMQLNNESEILTEIIINSGSDFVKKDRQRMKM